MDLILLSTYWGPCGLPTSLSHGASNRPESLFYRRDRPGPRGRSFPHYAQYWKRQLREGAGRCSSAAPARREGGHVTFGPEPRGAATAVDVAPGDCAPAGPTRRRAERRGGEGRGARGADEEGGGTGGSGSARRGSPAPRAASVWSRRPGAVGEPKSGQGPVPPPPPATRPARELGGRRQAADGVYLSGERAGKRQGARERSARAGAEPALALPACLPASPAGSRRGPAQSARRPGTLQRPAPRTTERSTLTKDSRSASSAATAVAAAGPGLVGPRGG